MIEKVGRRDMMRMLGVGGLALSVSSLRSRGIAQQLSGGSAPARASLGLFVALDPSGTVHIVAHRSEMGQGIRTALAAVVADELEADWDRVRIVQADGDLRYGSQDTDGSRSGRRFFLPMREAGASARLMLERAAAARWHVPASECHAQAHEVHHEPSGRSLPFGALAEEAGRLPVPSRRELHLKDPADFRFVGHGMPSLDLEAMTTGRAVFGADVVRPGMLTAMVVRPPSVGAHWSRYDRDAAMAVPGVRKVVEIPVVDLPTGFAPLGGVAVVADHTWAALQGRRALAVEWEDETPLGLRQRDLPRGARRDREPAGARAALAG